MSTTIQGVIKKWGNSFAVIIPKDIMKKENIKENEEVTFIVVPNSQRALKELFGIAKGKIKKSGQEIKDELRKELYD